MFTNIRHGILFIYLHTKKSVALIVTIYIHDIVFVSLYNFLFVFQPHNPYNNPYLAPLAAQAIHAKHHGPHAAVSPPLAAKVIK